ncbi:lipase family protein [Corynebacterium sp. USCH3]|uniref:lipase family protein n=1 Tax=Corynebacterium sp. USCH3 TaxID=3024840 RepID=UPI003097DFDB
MTILRPTSPRALVTSAVLALSTVAATTAVSPASAGTAEISRPAPGTPVTVEDLPEDLVLTHASRGWLFEYATTGPDGGAATSLGTLYLPDGDAPDGGWPVVAYGHGTQGLGDRNVSYTGWVGEENTGDQYLAKWLDAGFAVAAPEYVGLGTDGVHPYLNTRSAGAAMIDVVRAATTVSPDVSTTFVTNGYSQGGHASVAAASMVGEYAPELHLAAATAGGVPAGVADEITKVAPWMQVTQPDLMTYFGYVLAGFRAADPDFPLDDYLTAKGRDLVDAAEELNYLEMAEAIGSTTVGDLVTRPLSDGPLSGALARHLNLPTTGWDAPVFIYQQAFDMVSPMPYTNNLVATARTNGQDVTYRVDRDPAGHAGWTDGLPQALEFATAATAAPRQ